MGNGKSARETRWGQEALFSLVLPAHRWRTAGKLRISMVAQETEDRKPKLATRLLS